MKFTALIGRVTGVGLLVALLGTSGMEANASLLPPNSIQNPAVSAPDVGGTQVVSQSPDFLASTFAGSLTTTVDVNDPSNPFGAGDLTFIFQMANSAESINALQRLTVNGFGGFSVDASFINAAGETQPAYVTRSADGTTIGFNWLNSGSLTQIAPGGTSNELVLQTNATHYGNTTAAIIGGSITNAPTYMPVPEPSSLMLTLAGVCALIATQWRRLAIRSAR